MRVLAIIPPYSLTADHKAVIPAKAMLPVGILAIASGLKQLGCEVQVCDLVFTPNWQTKLASALKQQFDVFLLCCPSARNIPAVKLVASVLRSKFGSTRIVLGGNLCVQFGCKDFRKLGIEVNAVVRGYGHGVLPAVFRTEGDIQPSEVPAELPLPALELLDRKTHRLYHHACGGQYPIIGPGGFGCRFRCRYCQAHMGTPLVFRNNRSIAEEIQQAKQFGYTHLWCVDNCCLASYKSAKEFDSLVASQKLTWSGMTRPEDVVNLGKNSVDVSQRLQALSALTEIAIGVESVSKLALKRWHRTSSSSSIQKALSYILATNRIKATAFVILDAPGSTEEDFWQLREFLATTKPSTISWTFCNPSPQEILSGERKAEEYGFYHWPFGLSEVSPARVAQHAMILSGESWCGWQVARDNPYFENSRYIGVNFKNSIRLFQAKTARATTGNLWEAWHEEEI
ncbi:MAG: radical SAM protein [Patescibacteria group bacterium]|jgi:hypothetical protein